MSNHHNHNCRNLLTSLSDFVDGNLDDALCEEIERHMADCENCQIVINTLQKTVELYQETAEPPDVPNDVRTRLFKQLDLEEFLGT
jgi:anti-sigma factor (TIGR02949 family)